MDHPRHELPPNTPTPLTTLASSSPAAATPASMALGKFVLHFEFCVYFVINEPRQLTSPHHSSSAAPSSAGCMAAMNKGAHDGNGRIVGVIHEMFVVDGSDWFTGSSSVFTAGGRHEIIIARGNDLQERKRLLVKGADALVVLPGGPGTWDEVGT